MTESLGGKRPPGVSAGAAAPAAPRIAVAALAGSGPSTESGSDPRPAMPPPGPFLMNQITEEDEDCASKGSPSRANEDDESVDWDSVLPKRV